MQNDAALSALSRDELEQLVSIYAKNWLAMDGYWFQAVERKRGMDEAMEHDVAVWQGFTRTEARRIRALLRLPEQAGLDGLEKALACRMYARINRDEIIREGDALGHVRARVFSRARRRRDSARRLPRGRRR